MAIPRDLLYPLSCPIGRGYETDFGPRLGIRGDARENLGRKTQKKDVFRVNSQANIGFLLNALSFPILNNSLQSTAPHFCYVLECLGDDPP